MTRVAFLRHAPTVWNAAGRIQGHTDEPLSEAGRTWARQFRLPAEVRDWPLFSSPLSRAVETARLVGGEPQVEPGLIEMDWGLAEGRTLAALRADRPWPLQRPRRAVWISGRRRASPRARSRRG